MNSTSYFPCYIGPPRQKKSSDLFVKLRSDLRIIHPHLNMDKAFRCGMTKIPSPHQSHGKKNDTNHSQIKIQYQKYVGVGGDFDSAPNIDIVDDIEWDHEDETAKYFDKLISSCSKSKSKSLHLTLQALLGHITSLSLSATMYNCFDSRVSCSDARNSSFDIYPIAGTNNTDSDGRWQEKGEKMIKKHLAPNTLNIVILGAGPTGLALANALTELQFENATSPWHIENRGKHANTNVLILLFENRLENSKSNTSVPGRKKPYERNWITDIDRKFFIDEYTFDTRLKKVLKNIHELQEIVALPINALETLLLLSNRDRSHVVKVLYDDFQKYRDVLKETQNMIVFDATWHRLNPLQRPVPDSASSGISMFEYSPDSFASDRMQISSVREIATEMLSHQ